MLETILMIFFTILAICILMNISYIQPVYEKLDNKAKGIIRILVVLLIFILIVNKYIENKADDVVDEKIKLEQENLEEKSNEEKSFYESIVNKVYEEQNPKIPYIPDGFEHTEGEWNTGFVIKDKENNQYVWVPCVNNENNEHIPKLQKKTLQMIHGLVLMSVMTQNIENFYKVL